MSVLLRYNVPVLVEVDLSAGRVLRVNVDDEAITGPEDVSTVDEPDLRADDRTRAIDIAEQDWWPVWEFGW